MSEELAYLCVMIIVVVDLQRCPRITLRGRGRSMFRNNANYARIVVI